MGTMQQFNLDYTKEELEFKGAGAEEDEKIQNLRRQILQKEENRKNSQRNILLKTIKKPFFESEKSKEKEKNFKTRRQYNNFNSNENNNNLNAKEFNMAK